MDDFCDTLCALCSVLEEHCFVPGKVENWVIIIETNNVGMWSFPFKVKTIPNETFSYPNY